MRSRYAAYATGNVEYIIQTTDPTGPHFNPDQTLWRAELAKFCETTRFVGLTIVDAPDAQGDDGTVTFRAELVQQGQSAGFTEMSIFRRVDGRWLYVSGTQT